MNEQLQHGLKGDNAQKSENLFQKLVCCICMEKGKKSQQK